MLCDGTANYTINTFTVNMEKLNFEGVKINYNSLGVTLKTIRFADEVTNHGRPRGVFSDKKLKHDADRTEREI